MEHNSLSGHQEPNTMSSMVSGSAIPHLPSVTQGASQGVQTHHTSPPSSTSQEMIASGNSVIPMDNRIPRFLRPTGITPMAGSGSFVGTAQISQNTALGSFASATSNVFGNSNHGMSQPLPNIQGTVSMGQSVLGMSQGNLSGQIGQSGVGMNQNIMNGLGASSISSCAGTMMPILEMFQQGQAGMQPLGVTNSSMTNMSLPPQISGAMPNKCARVWKGALSFRKEGQPLAGFITELEAYTGASASETLARSWPPTLEIILLKPSATIREDLYTGRADFLVFRVLIQNAFLEGLHRTNHVAFVRLPSQTLILSCLNKANLFGLLLPFVFIPSTITRQQGQQHFQQQLLQSQQQQQQQQLQQQQQQQQLEFFYSDSDPGLDVANLPDSWKT